MIRSKKPSADEIAKLTAENEELRACLRWYVDNDDTREGGKWEQVNEYWLVWKRRAALALGDDP